MSSQGIARQNHSSRCIVIGFALGLAACGGGGWRRRSERRGQYTASDLYLRASAPQAARCSGRTARRLKFRSGALAVVTQIAVDQTTLGAPPLPPGLTPIGQMFAFTPHGTTFAAPVTVTTAVRSGIRACRPSRRRSSRRTRRTNGRRSPTRPSARAASRGQVTSFSDFQAAAERPGSPLVCGQAQLHFLESGQ